MSNPSRLSVAAAGLLIFLCAVSGARAAHGDPSGRVARLNDSRGEVSYSPSGEEQWVEVVRNRPLIRGDRLWAGQNSRAELQIGSAAIRLGPQTSFEILDLDDRQAQLKLTQGSINLRVRRMDRGQSFEIATPTLAFNIDRVGRYRIDVDPQSDETTIVVWDGAGQAFGEDANFPLRAGDTVRFYDAGLRDYEMFGIPRPDEFDRYCEARDRRLDRSVSLRYVDDDVVGYADLDDNGSWRPVAGYGNAWFPNRVDANWAPYRDGRWVWQEPFGWTWVDDAPWGFAPSHYGRWVNVSNQWGWIPGPRNVRPIYAPALVAFVGGRGWNASASFGGGSTIGWFPLGPREVYVPSYQASREYFNRVNASNTVISNASMGNVYTNYARGDSNVSQVSYANRSVTGAITAVPNNVFVNSKSVRQSSVRVDRSAGSAGEISRIAEVAPSVQSVIGGGSAAKSHPSEEAFDRRVMARSAPPADERPFAEREQQLQRNPGRGPQPRDVTGAPARGNGNGQQVQVLGDQSGSVNARTAGPRHGDEGQAPATMPAQPGQPIALDRSVDTRNGHGHGRGDRGRDPVGNSQDNQRRPSDSATPADQNRQSPDQQQAERQRQRDAQQQQDQRQRRADSDRQAADQQAADRQQADRQQADQQAADRQQAERQRQRDAQQQQDQAQRRADSERQAADQQAADRQQAERQRQRDAQQQQDQAQRRADSERQAADQQQAERQRQQIVQQQAAQQQAAQQQAAQQQAAQQQAAQQQAAQQQAAQQQAAQQQAAQQQAAQQQAAQQQAARQAELEAQQRAAAQQAAAAQAAGQPATPPAQTTGGQPPAPGQAEPPQQNDRGNSSDHAPRKHQKKHKDGDKDPATDQQADDNEDPKQG